MNPAGLYWRLPDGVRGALGVVFRRLPPLRNRPQRYEFEYHRELEESQWFSADRLRAIQADRLRRLIMHCSSNVPYYRRVFKEGGIVPEDIREPDDLYRLPLLTKKTVRENYEDLISRTAEPSELRAIATGGSTGTPMRFLFNEYMLGVRRAHWWRWSDFAGVELFGDRMVYCGGSSYEGPGRAVVNRGVWSPSRDRLSLGSTSMSDEVLDRFLSDMRRFRGDYIRGYASGIYLLAKRLIELGERIPMKAVLTSSDTLFEPYRATISEAFSCAVFDHYGQNEDSLTATECEAQQGLHINVESCIAESVGTGGEPVFRGDGRLVSTPLHNYAMPLIRYVVGDIGCIGEFDSDCSCGRRLQKLESFTGRDDEIIVTPSGRRIGCGSMNQPMKQMHGEIGACQYVQQDRGRLLVRVVRGEKWRAEASLEDLVARTREHVGEDMVVEGEVVARIETRPNGKFQFIVSQLAQDQPDRK